MRDRLYTIHPTEHPHEIVVDVRFREDGRNAMVIGAEYDRDSKTIEFNRRPVWVAKGVLPGQAVAEAIQAMAGATYADHTITYGGTPALPLPEFTTTQILELMFIQTELVHLQGQLSKLVGTVNRNQQFDVIPLSHASGRMTAASTFIEEALDRKE